MIDVWGLLPEEQRARLIRSAELNRRACAACDREAWWAPHEPGCLIARHEAMEAKREATVGEGGLSG